MIESNFEINKDFCDLQDQSEESENDESEEEKDSGLKDLF